MPCFVGEGAQTEGLSKVSMECNRGSVTQVRTQTKQVPFFNFGHIRHVTSHLKVSKIAARVAQKIQYLPVVCHD